MLIYKMRVRGFNYLWFSQLEEVRNYIARHTLVMLGGKNHDRSYSKREPEFDQQNNRISCHQQQIMCQHQIQLLFSLKNLFCLNHKTKEVTHGNLIINFRLKIGVNGTYCFQNVQPVSVAKNILLFRIQEHWEVYPVSLAPTIPKKNNYGMYK